MKLMNLKLKNFKGIRFFELQAEGENVAVFGDNGLGKTTLFDAFIWVLFDKDSQNKKDFAIKTLDADNHPLHGLEHEVEAGFILNGDSLVLRKVYAERWTKKRGNVEREFVGHTTDYFIDGVPVTKKEYTAKIDEIVTEDIFKLLTSPTYFNTQLHWQERRKILLEICGDIQIEEIIASNQTLKRLPEVLKGRTIDQHRKVLVARRAQINAELEKIPIRISEVENSLPEINDWQPDELVAEIRKYQTQIQHKQQELHTIKNGGEVAEATKRLRQVEADLLKLENEFQTAIQAQIRGKRLIINQLEDQANILRRELNNMIDYPVAIAQLQKDAAKMLTEAAELRKRWAAVNQETIQCFQPGTCPTCGQTIPEERLQEAHSQALAAFNLDKAKRLEKIQIDGKAKMAEVEALETRIAELRKQEEQEKERLQIKETGLLKIEARILVLTDEIGRQQKADAAQGPSYQSMLQEKEAVEGAIRIAEQGCSLVVGCLQEELNALLQEKAMLEKAMTDFEYRQKGQHRLAELKQQQKDLAREFENLEEELYLTEEFIRTKVSLLEERINNRFKMAKFKMFEEQINGGLQECCETMYNGVPYSSNLNNAARINVGIDVINVLSDHYRFTAPIFVDNAESVTELLATKGQLIRLIVSKADAKLRVECADTLKEAV